MFNLKKDQKFNITYFAKKYGKYITRSGQWTEQSKECFSKDNNKLFVYYDLESNGYRTAVGDITLNVKGE